MSASLSDITVTPIADCQFNFDKGLWETDPEHWVWSREWVLVAMLWAISLERGVPR